MDLLDEIEAFERKIDEKYFKPTAADLSFAIKTIEEAKKETNIEVEFRELFNRFQTLLADIETKTQNVERYKEGFESKLENSQAEYETISALYEANKTKNADIIDQTQEINEKLKKINAKIATLPKEGKIRQMKCRQMVRLFKRILPIQWKGKTKGGLITQSDDYVEFDLAKDGVDKVWELLSS
eukprot:TRINITY_DN780341_c0_g1_i1.p1 TRINITY_DN780341_c0_g1~~TRINITY_DN780341_c0_g1_i1.p1  ORF type:complete len:184 (+),score=28.72 TRINITY_DN780341_c0_g1_i1:50-601(+)